MQAPDLIHVRWETRAEEMRTPPLKRNATLGARPRTGIGELAAARRMNDRLTATEMTAKLLSATDIPARRRMYMRLPRATRVAGLSETQGLPGVLSLPAAPRAA